MLKRYTQVFQERKQGSRVKRHYKSVKINLYQSIPTVCVLNMLDLVRENNHFGFNGKKYIQTEGTAI
jgi:hypothetical protein